MFDVSTVLLHQAFETIVTRERCFKFGSSAHGIAIDSNRMIIAELRSPTGGVAGET